MKMTIEMGRGFNEAVAEMGSMGRVLIEAVSEGLEKSLPIPVGNIVTSHLKGQSLKFRSGLLAKNVDGWMAGQLEAVIGVADGSPVDAYKWLLGDEQKTITPKRSKFLVIPIGENLTSSGVPRYSSPRQVSDGFFFKSKADNLLFGRKNGKHGKIRPLFVLVKSVFVQGSGALYDGVMESLDGMTEVIQLKLNERLGN